MKFNKLALATVAAFGLAGVAQAELPVVEGFELWGNSGTPDFTAPITGANEYGKEGSTAVWFGGADSDETAVMAYDNNAAQQSYWPYYITESGGNLVTNPVSVGNSYLKVSNSNPLWRVFKPYTTESIPSDFGDLEAYEDPEDPDASSDMEIEVGEGLFVDTLVQFTPSEDAPTPDAGSKLIVWMNTNGVLCVTANKWLADGTHERGDFETSQSVDTNTWYRLTVKAYDTVLDADGTSIHGFKVYINSHAVSSAAAAMGEDDLDEYTVEKDDLEEDLAAGKVFFSLDTIDSTAKLAAVGFKGEGLVDSIVLSDVDPIAEEVSVSDIDFTLSWGADVSAAWYAIGSDTNEVVSPATIKFDTDDLGTTIAYGGVASDAWSTVIPAEVVLNSSTSVTVVATAAATGGDAGVTGDLAGFTATQLQTAFPDATPVQINADENAYYEYQFGLGLNTLSGEPTLKIVDIAESATAGYWDIKVQVLNGSTPLAIDNGATAQTSPMKATLKVIAADTLAGLATAGVASTDDYEIVYDATTTDLTITVKTGAFFKARIDYAVPANN